MTRPADKILCYGARSFIIPTALAVGKSSRHSAQ